MRLGPISTLIPINKRKRLTLLSNSQTKFIAKTDINNKFLFTYSHQ